MEEPLNSLGPMARHVGTVARGRVNFVVGCNASGPSCVFTVTSPKGITMTTKPTSSGQPTQARQPLQGTTRRVVRALSLAVLSIALMATSAATAEAQPTKVQRTEVQPTEVRPAHDRPTDREELRLRCEVDIIGDQRGVLCRWSEATAQVRGYQLYRIVNGAPRELVATVPNGDRLHAFDTDVLPGDRVIYGVVGRNGAGRVVAIGGPVRLGISR